MNKPEPKNEFEFEVVPLHNQTAITPNPEVIQRAEIFSNAFAKLFLLKANGKTKIRVKDTPSLIELKGSAPLRSILKNLGFSTRPGRKELSNTTIITDKREVPEEVTE